MNFEEDLRWQRTKLSIAKRHLDSELVLSAKKGVSNDILIAAPHSIRHYSDNAFKKSEAETAILVSLLNTHLGIPGVCKVGNATEDVDKSPDSTFKQIIADLNPKYLFSLHSRSDMGMYDLNITIINEEYELAYSILKAAIPKGFRVLVDNKTNYAGICFNYKNSIEIRISEDIFKYTILYEKLYLVLAEVVSDLLNKTK